jgi:hypothetical protein
MKTTWIDNGTKSVCITCDYGRVMARKYVDNREVATLEVWNGKTEQGAIKWAKKKLMM